MRPQLALAVSVLALAACGPSLPTTDAPPQFPPIIGNGGGLAGSGGAGGAAGGVATGGGASGGSAGGGGGSTPTAQVVSSVVIDPAGVSIQRPDNIDLKPDALGTLHLATQAGAIPATGVVPSTAPSPRLGDTSR